MATTKEAFKFHGFILKNCLKPKGFVDFFLLVLSSSMFVILQIFSLDINTTIFTAKIISVITGKFDDLFILAEPVAIYIHHFIVNTLGIYIVLNENWKYLFVLISTYFVRGTLSWSHFIGQSGSAVKVYSDC